MRSAIIRGVQRPASFVLFVLTAVPAATASCRDDSFVLVKERTLESDATIRLKDFQRSSLTPDGKREWNLKAGEAYIYRKDQEQKRIVAYSFRFEQFDPAGRITGILTGERGEIDYDKRSVEMSGHVEYIEPAKSRMSGERMQFNLDTKILTSNDPVILEEKGVFTQCRAGVIADRANGRQVCRSPAVRRTSTGGKEDSFDNLFQ